MHAYNYDAPRPDGLKDVWIVDDDRSIRWVLEKALAREGIPFKTFPTAYEVLQALGTSQPQVLVSDIRMPENRAGAAQQGEGALPPDSDHHHDRVLDLTAPRRSRARCPNTSACLTSTTRWR
jgi:CheY-like chemotaxis protein